MPTTWVPFDQTKPTTAQTRQAAIDSIRNNIFAIAVLMICTGVPVPGWTYTNSVTRGEGTPGTAGAPIRIYFTTGSGGTAQWIKTVLTYDVSGNVTKIAFYYSSDNEATYDALDDGTNYVLTLTYDGSGNLTATTWGNTP